jgi:Co/Zn/Cd efflux system component
VTAPARSASHAPCTRWAARIAAYDPVVSRPRRLTVVLLFNLGLATALVITGLAAHSLAVLAASGDYLADAAAVGLSPGHLACRPPAGLPGCHQRCRAGERGAGCSY